jgi:hypothetical protein
VSVEYIFNSLLMFDEDESTSQSKQMDACCRRDADLFSTNVLKEAKECVYEVCRQKDCRL